jgi:hypothetical protein
MRVPTLCICALLAGCAWAFGPVHDETSAAPATTEPAPDPEPLAQAPAPASTLPATAAPSTAAPATTFAATTTTPAPASAAPGSAAPATTEPAERTDCCRVCRRRQACGDGCISKRATCHRPPGCACDG